MFYSYMYTKCFSKFEQPNIGSNVSCVILLRYRNSFKHNLCLEMLQNGFHKSYAELYALVKEQNEARIRAGPESLMWSQVMLENEPEKLTTLSRHLCHAEAAERAGG